MHPSLTPSSELDRKKFNISSNPNDIIGMGEDDIGSELHDTHFTPELNLVRQENAFVGLKVCQTETRSPAPAFH